MGSYGLLIETERIEKGMPFFVKIRSDKIEACLINRRLPVHCTFENGGELRGWADAEWLAVKPLPTMTVMNKLPAKRQSRTIALPEGNNVSRTV